MKDSLWGMDLFRCESATLRTHWVLVVMDQYTRRIIGFGVHCNIRSTSAALQEIVHCFPIAKHFPDRFPATRCDPALRKYDSVRTHKVKRGVKAARVTIRHAQGVRLPRFRTMGLLTLITSGSLVTREQRCKISWTICRIPAWPFDYII